MFLLWQLNKYQICVFFFSHSFSLFGAGACADAVDVVVWNKKFSLCDLRSDVFPELWKSYWMWFHFGAKLFS